MLFPVLISAVAALQLAGGVPVARLDAGQAQQLVLRDSAEAAMLRYFDTWKNAWRASEGMRHPVRIAVRAFVQLYERQSPEEQFRRTLTRCDLNVPPEHGPYWFLAGTRWIRSERRTLFVCPSWYLPADELPWDERVALDDAIDSGFQPTVRESRGTAMGALRQLLLAAPHSRWAVGQYVRLSVEQGEFQDALNALRTCGTEEWWCEVLRGYVHARSGSLIVADTIYANAMVLAPEYERCKWTDHALLLRREGRDAYARLDCAARQEVNRTLWWLADPLYSTPGNERRAEQFTRYTHFVVLGDLDYDERFDWRPQTGADARIEMVLRYGWPAFHYWPGDEADLSLAAHSAHDGGGWSTRYTLGTGVFPYYHVAGPSVGQAVTSEYSREQRHLVPSWSALESPFASRAEDWDIAPSDGTGYRPPESGVHSGTPAPPRWVGRRQEDVEDRWPVLAAIAATMEWWPREHAAPPRPLRPLPDGQTALFRRRDATLVAVSVRPDSGAPGGGARWPAEVRLLATHDPDSISTVALREYTGARDAVLSGETAARPTILAVEALNNDGSAERLRFGATPKPPLSALVAGELDVSEPAVLTLRPGDAELSSQPDSALARLASSLVVPETRRIGVYWEAYGVALDSSLTTAIWIERSTRDGIMRRLGNALAITRDVNTPVVVRWTDAQARLGGAVVERQPGLIGRSVVLDLGGLQPGEYWLTVAVAQGDAPPVSARRQITVQ